MVALLLAGGVQRVIWLPLAYDPAGSAGEPRYGLLDPDGTVRPAGDAVRSIAVAAGRVSSIQGVRSASVSGVAFGAAGRTTMILRSDADAAAIVAAPPGQGATARTAGGQQVPWGAGGRRLGQEPVLLSVPAAPGRALRLIG